MTTGRTISTTTRPDDRRSDLSRLRAAALPPSVTARLPGGLWVTAVRLATVARVEMRLTLPLAPGHAGSRSVGTATAPVLSARAAVLAACVLRGTTGTDGTRVETALGRIGADVVPLVGAGCLALRGGVLTDGLADLLRTLAGALSCAQRPDHEVNAARTVLRGQTAVARVSPALAAHALLCRHAPRWAGDPQQPPAPELIAAVTPAQVRALHARVLVPARARLVLVGDLDPDGAVDAVREAFAGWTSDAVRPLVLDPDEGPPPTPPEDTPARRVGLHPAVREGTAQVRLCAARGDEPLTPALRLASLVLGGHPESRLVARLRRRHGYTYAVRCRPESLPGDGTGTGAGGPLPPPPGHRLFIEADTAPAKAHALLEALGEELARMVSDPPSAAEVAQAGAHFTGSSLTTWATQAGLADALAHHPGPLPPADPAELWDLMENLRRTPPDAVAAAGRAFFPGRFTGVVIGAEGPPPGPSRHWTIGRTSGAGD